MTLIEQAKLKGKALLIESCSVSVKPEDIEFFPKQQFIESEGKQYPARGVLRNVPVTKFTENLNGRIYPKKLWEKVVKEGTAEGTLSLADHPDDSSDGSVKDIVGVWKNFKLGEDKGVADLYLTGRTGQDLLEALNSGARLGVSSVGFGEFDHDGKTVKAESFELERLGDMVLNPSQKVFATEQNLQKDKPNIVEELPQKEEIKESMNTNKKNVEIHSEESIVMLDKVQEANLKNQVRVAITEARKNPNRAEALAHLRELDEIVPDEMKDTKDKIDAAAKDVEEKMEAEIQSAQDDLDATKKELDDVKEKLDVANKTLEEIREKYQKAEAIVEKVKDVDPEDFKTLQENETLMLNDIEHLKEEKGQLEKKLKTCQETKKVAVKEHIEKRIKALKEKLDGSKKINLKLKNRLAFAEKHISQLEEIMEDELGYDFDDEDEKKDDQIVSEDDEGAEDTEDVVIADDEAKTEEDDEDEEEISVEAPAEEKKEEEGAELGDDTEDEMTEEDEAPIEGEVEDEDEEIKTEDEDEDEEKDFSSDVDNIDGIMEELDSEDTFKDIIEPKEDDVLNAKKEAKKSKKVAPKAKMTEKAALRRRIVEFYREAVKETPALKDVKDIILNSSTLLEATSKVYKFKEKKNEIINVENKQKMKESRPRWIGTRR